jgi:REP element-mobilizing transposase RayT
MPRKARQKSESGIYHVMLRGIDRQLIFEDTEDYLRFLDIVKECRGICDFKLFAYCLMGNHAHLLLKVQNEGLEAIFKRIGGRYVYYYNVKYRRVGHLFQDRFKSEPVDDDAYFLTVLRYIHQNPVKAKLCPRVEDYPFSSFPEYLHESTFVDTDFALSMIDCSEFARFNNAPNSDTCMELAPPVRRAVTDTQARTVIEKISHCKTITEFQELDKKKKERFIKQIYSQGVSIRQLSRLTGITKGKIEKFVKA